MDIGSAANARRYVRSIIDAHVRSARSSLKTMLVFITACRWARRAFLCGVDVYSGQDYSHRKEWILDRLRELAGLFVIEVCGYSVMSNHLHLMLRNRPDIAGQWSAAEIALR